MDDFHPETSYGPDVAHRYDDDLRGDEGAAATFLAQYARGERALEFAIGTGRIALPLADHGVRVDGIELSSHMVARLRQKPGGEGLDVRVGDMASETTGKTYPLVYLVFNTIYNILTQEGQLECFKNASRHLDEEGLRGRGGTALRLVERWGGWNGERFSPESPFHVSVYRAA